MTDSAELSAERLGVAIVGCGRIGRKRKAALGGARLVACVDRNLDRARDLAADSPAVAVATRLGDLLGPAKAGHYRNDAGRHIDIVIVATTNDALADAACAALEAGCHVLVEKPGARTLPELDRIHAAATRARRLVRVGFNHRYHPALLKARELFESGTLGTLMFVRGRYGHGGRVGYEKEWRADPARAGGGELIDQGVHLIDLSRWFLGDFVTVNGFALTYFWPMPVDDNAFLLLRTAREQTAFLHVSCTEWKNLFSLEIYGHDAKLDVDGLGGSYGVERVAFHKMLPEMGPPETTIWEYPRGDRSWALEFEEFLEDIRLDRQPAAGLSDARAALQVVEAIYRCSAGVQSRHPNLPS